MGVLPPPLLKESILTTVTDAAWVRQSFMLPKHTLSSQDARKRMFSNAAFKFTDTTLGGNFAINPPPQFTRFADIKVRGRFSKSKGLGRYYSEAIDDTRQDVHIRFGVPEYNSLTNFFGNFYDPTASSLARTGRAPGIFYKLGKAAGFVVTIPLQPFIIGGAAYRFFAKKPASKYYYLKPTMPLYWNAVNTMVNGIAVNMGVIPRVGDAKTNEMIGIGADETYSSSDVEKFHNVLPDIFRKKGGIDIYSVATRAQRLADKHHTEMADFMSKYKDRGQVSSFFRKWMKESEDGVGSLPLPASRGIDAYLSTYAESMYGVVGEAPDGKQESADQRSLLERMDEAMVAEWRDGGAFVTVRVNHTGTASESFSNTVGESDIQGKINGMASSSRNARFSMAEGNLGDGVIAGTVESIGAAMKDFVTGALDSVNMSGIAALAGSAFVDIPKHWNGSTANLPRMEYTMELRSPYGNKLSRLMNLWVPTSMILAGALPLSTGTQSYNSPFICEVYDKGRAQTRLGMIDSVSITRGVGNLGWTNVHEALGVDITFSIVDFSSIMHMPIVAGLSAVEVAGAALVAAGNAINDTLGNGLGSGAQIGGGALLAKGLFDDDNAYTDYLAVIGSLTLTDQIYPMRKLKLNLTRKLADFDSWLSPSHHANWSMGTWSSKMISAFSQVTDRGS